MEWSVTLYSFLSLGSPKSDSALQRALGTLKITPRQLVAAEMLAAEILLFAAFIQSKLWREDAASRG